MGMAAKLNILTAEGSRRLRNCDLETPWNEQVEYLNKLMVSMMWGGYTPKIREIVARRVLAKYTNNLRNFREQGRPLYRSKYERNQVMKPDKTNWFRKEGATATLTVPCTRNSQLAKDLRKALVGTGPRGTQVKIIEKPGPKLMAGVAKNNPFPRKHCGRLRCPFTLTGEKCNDQCWKEGVVYAANCERCYQKQIEEDIVPINKLYIGETSRTLFSRANQHLNDYRKAHKQNLVPIDADQDDQMSSWMYDHSLTHGGPDNFDTDYNFVVMSSHRDPFSRQVTESVRIQRALQYGIHTDKSSKEVQVVSMNRKGEYFSPIERWNHD